MCHSQNCSGNLLELVISEISDRINIMTTAPGPFVSDHRAIITTLNIKESAKMQVKKCGKYIKSLKNNGPMNSTKQI